MCSLRRDKLLIFFFSLLHFSLHTFPSLLGFCCCLLAFLAIPPTSYGNFPGAPTLEILPKLLGLAVQLFDSHRKNWISHQPTSDRLEKRGKRR
ncbi:hypothetical protein V8C42DRAFT_313479 [Trichoderma barbatum]